jgi:hypothetical protein
VLRFDQKMHVWAVYDSPRGFPDVYVAQKWEVTRNSSSRTDEIITDPDLDNLRRRLVDEEHCGGRISAKEGDDPEVIELWLPVSVLPVH